MSSHLNVTVFTIHSTNPEQRCLLLWDGWSFPVVSHRAGTGSLPLPLVGCSQMSHVPSHLYKIPDIHWAYANVTISPKEHQPFLNHYLPKGRIHIFADGKTEGPFLILFTPWSLLFWTWHFTILYVLIYIYIFFPIISCITAWAFNVCVLHLMMATLWMNM